MNKLCLISLFVLGLSACSAPVIPTDIVTMPLTTQVQQNDLADDDQDGVINAREKCEASVKGSKVDNDGCGNDIVHKVRQELKVNFANNSAEVAVRYYQDIEKLANFMKRYSELDVVIEGHTSKQGSQAHNQILSEERARAVADILVSRFNIPTFRVSSVGYGFSKLLDESNSAEAHAANRRIVAELSSESVNTNQKWHIFSVDETTD